MSVLRKNIVSLFVLQGANYLLPLITVPYLVRVLGPENFGRIAFAQAFIQYFVVFTNYSFDQSATRAVTLSRDDLNELSRLFTSVMTIKLLLMLLGFLLMGLLVAIFPAFNHDWALYCLVYLTVVGHALFPVWFYQGLERMGQITVFTILARSTMVMAIFLFVTKSTDYVLAAAFWSAGLLLAGLLALAYIPRFERIHLSWPGLRRLRKDILDGWHIFVAMLGGNVYNNSNVFVLGLLASPAVVGYFAAADKLIKAVQGITHPVSQAVYPHIAALVVKSKEQALTFIGRLLYVMGGSMFVVSIILLLSAAPLSGLLFGDKFHHSIHLIELMSFVPFLIGLNIVFGAQFLVQFDLGRLLSFSIILPALVHICVLYFITEAWGANGVAVLLVFTETFVFVIRLIGLIHGHKKMLWHVLMARTS